MEAKVEINPNWTASEPHLMQRLHRIVSGNDDGPFSKDYGYRWQLDGSNDWWAEVREGNLLVIANRYSQEKADAVAKLCGLLFT